MALEYPIGTKVSLMPAECVTNFMGLDGSIWQKQIAWNNNVHVITDKIVLPDDSFIGYYFKSTYCDAHFCWNAEYVVPILEDLSQYDFE